MCHMPAVMLQSPDDIEDAAVPAAHERRWPGALLTASDPDPVIHLNEDGPSPILLLCDHADNITPSTLDLGVGKQDLCRHIGYDIGAMGVSRRLSESLGAELVAQRYSRLVIDCNRPPHVVDSMPARVDGTEVPANAALTPRQAAARVAEVFHPYHAAVASALDRRAAEGRRSVIVAVHSFTPSHSDYPGERPWPISLLFHREEALSLALCDLLTSDGLLVGMNEPYRVGDLADYTIPVHAESRQLLSTLIEVRQDGLGSPEEEDAWAERLARHLPRAIEIADGGT